MNHFALFFRIKLIIFYLFFQSFDFFLHFLELLWFFTLFYRIIVILWFRNSRITVDTFWKKLFHLDIGQSVFHVFYPELWQRGWRWASLSWFQWSRTTPTSEFPLLRLSGCALTIESIVEWFHQFCYLFFNKKIDTVSSSWSLRSFNCCFFPFILE